MNIREKAQKEVVDSLDYGTTEREGNKKVLCCWLGCSQSAYYSLIEMLAWTNPKNVKVLVALNEYSWKP